jgi:hypothetical protein
MRLKADDMHLVYNGKIEGGRRADEITEKPSSLMKLMDIHLLHRQGLPILIQVGHLVLRNYLVSHGEG